MAIDAVGKRFRWALRHRGVSAAELGRHLGVTRSAVSQWWATKNPTSPRAKIGQISELLNLSADWLLTGRGEPLHENYGSAPSAEFAPTKGPDIAGGYVVGTAEAEAWRETPPTRELIAPDDRGELPVDPTQYRPNLAGLRQFLFEVRGSSANQTIHSGEYALCVDYRRMRPAGPQHGDLVVVKKHRGTNEYKIFVARLKYHEHAWELHYESNDPRWRHERPIRLAEDPTYDTVDNGHIEIVGYVFGVFRANPQPMFGVQHLARAHAWRIETSI
jgi:transcriptional regulator with XRE-family HTH domain